MIDFLIIVFTIGEFVAYITGLYFWMWKDNVLNGIICVCLAIYFNLCKNENIRKLEKLNKL